MVCQRLQIGQAVYLAARVNDNDLVATISEFAAKYGVMTSIHGAKHVGVGPGSTE
jgi:threonine synthase